jgi:hypothetical protein
MRGLSRAGGILAHNSSSRKFSNAVTQGGRAGAEFDGMASIPSMVWRVSVRILLRRQQPRALLGTLHETERHVR